MIPGLETLLGGLIGGAFRLGQAWLDAREKDRDRDHEFRMTELQGQLAARADERRLREIGLEGDYRLAQADVEALMAGVRAQAAEARAAGGWTAALSATVRPLVTYLLVLMYIGIKAVEVSVAAAGGEALMHALQNAYGEPDMALFSSILSFWFVDRSLRRSATVSAPIAR